MPKSSPEPPVLLICSNFPTYLPFISEVLALPAGASYHFRYRYNYVSREIFENPSCLINRKAYVVHLNKSDLGEEYIPVREGQIFWAEKLGEHLRIDFTVGGVVTYDETNRVAGKRNQFSEVIEKAFGQRNAKTGYDGDFIVTLTNDPFEVAVGSEQCVSVVSELVRFKDFLEPLPTVFLFSTVRRSKFPSKRDLKDDPTEWLVDSDGLFGPDGTLTFDAGKSYRIHILEYLPTEDAWRRRLNASVAGMPFDLTLRTDGSIIHAAVGTAQIRGRYDDLELVPTCKASPSTSQTVLQVVATPEAPHVFPETGQPATHDTVAYAVPQLRFDRVVVKASLGLVGSIIATASLFVIGALAIPIISALHGDVTWAPAMTAAFDGGAAIPLALLAASAK